MVKNKFPFTLPFKELKGFLRITYLGMKNFSYFASLF
jgi:hypothetical protein